VEATISELWFLEYRYQGPARVQGAFALVPLRRLWVGPAVLTLDGGRLSAGLHPLAASFKARVDLTIAPVDLQAAPGLLLLRALTCSLRFDTAVEDLGVADLYLPGLQAQGSGRLVADWRIVGGRLQPGTALEATVQGGGQHAGYSFKGDAHAALALDPATKAPTIDAELSGALGGPLLTGTVAAALSGVTGKLVLEDGDLTRGLRLERFYAVLGEARVADARAVTHAVAGLIPIIGPFVLGDGPLVASATAYLTPAYTLVRLKHLELGEAALVGAAVPGPRGWTGAAVGHFGRLPVGLRLRHSKIEPVLFASHPWLDVELVQAGIEP